VVLVGDRGMLTEARICEELRGQEGLDWITALRAPAIRALVEEKSLQPSLFDQRAMATVTSPEYPGERLIVCKNPLLGEERRRKREELLAATEQELEKIVQATHRPKRRLKGQDKIGLRVGKGLNRFKMAKHFTLQITDEGFAYQRDEAAVAAEAALDGIYVVRTSVAESLLDEAQSVQAYKGLSKVERAFRSLKSVDLKIRPIYHHLADRVRAHVLLCVLAYYVEWHMREELRTPMPAKHGAHHPWLRRRSPSPPSARPPPNAARTVNQFTAFNPCWPIWPRLPRTASRSLC
jgi:transposase